MAFGDDDLLAMLDSDFGVDVVYEPTGSAQHCRGIVLRAPLGDAYGQGVGAEGTGHQVDVFLKALTGLEEDAPITVDGDAYVTRRVEASPVHPRMTRIHLAEVR